MQSFTKELWKSLFKNFSPSRFFIHMTILNSANIIKKKVIFFVLFCFLSNFAV